MLGVDEGHDAAHGLSLRDDLQRERGLAARFRAVHLHDAAARHAAYAERRVERQRAGRDDPDVEVVAALAELHDGALAELGLDLIGGQLEHLRFFFVHAVPSLPAASAKDAERLPLTIIRTYVCWSSIFAKEACNPSIARPAHVPMARIQRAAPPDPARFPRRRHADSTRLLRRSSAFPAPRARTRAPHARRAGALLRACRENGSSGRR